MEGPNIKAICFSMIVFCLFAVLGMAIMKINTAASQPPDSRTAGQKIDALESSSGMQSSSAKGFINNERSRRAATKAAEDAAFGVR